MSKFLQRLDKELKEKSKKPDIPVIHAIPIVVSMLIILWIMSSSIVLFYDTFLKYALAAPIFLIILLFIGTRAGKSKLPLVSFSFAIVTVAVFVVPVALHYFFLKKEEVCFNTVLAHKHFSVKLDGGTIRLGTNQSNLKKIAAIEKIDGISKYEYDHLPPNGSKIQVCGEVSNVGFSYTSINTVESKNTPNTLTQT